LSNELVGDFSKEERLGMEEGSLPSCLGDRKCARVMIEIVLAHRGGELKGGFLVYTGDNQGSIYHNNIMSGQVKAARLASLCTA
jgi:hypothetical protein